LCCAPAYLEKHPAPRCSEDLAGHNCLRYAYAPFGDNWPFLDAGGNPVIARVSCNLITTCPETLRAAAIAGTGIGTIPVAALVLATAVVLAVAIALASVTVMAIAVVATAALTATRALAAFVTVAGVTIMTLAATALAAFTAIAAVVAAAVAVIVATVAVVVATTVAVIVATTVAVVVATTTVLATASAGVVAAALWAGIAVVVVSGGAGVVRCGRAGSGSGLDPGQQLGALRRQIIAEGRRGLRLSMPRQSEQSRNARHGEQLRADRACRAEGKSYHFLKSFEVNG